MSSKSLKPLLRGIDETADVKDTAQLAVCVCNSIPHLIINKRLFKLNAMHRNSTGGDIFFYEDNLLKIFTNFHFINLHPLCRTEPS
jgi:hypothetical protein